MYEIWCESSLSIQRTFATSWQFSKSFILIAILVADSFLRLSHLFSYHLRTSPSCFPFLFYCGFQIVFEKFSRFFLLLTSSSLLLSLSLSLLLPLLSCLSYSVFLSETHSSSLLPPETHIQRQAALHDCLPCTPRLLGDGTERKNIFCTGPTRAAKAGQKSLVPARQAQRTN